jgi:hypothetical protein
MVTYIYFVKCPNCEDEHFDFFDEAKEYALGCMGQKPIITQVEVERNDFGECTDSHDLGTVWSWEDVMKDTCTDDEPAKCVFTRDDLKDYVPDEDPEFDTLDNSVDYESKLTEAAVTEFIDLGDGCKMSKEAIYDELAVNGNDIDIPLGNLQLDPADMSFSDHGYYAGSELNIYKDGNEFTMTVWHTSDDGDLVEEDSFKSKSFEEFWQKLTTYVDVELEESCERKPIPEGMTIEQLVEAMEENEDEVECVWCNELYDKSDCKYIEDEGYVCPDCQESTVKCTWCEELFDKDQCRYEVDLGWLCSRCEMAIKSRGETLTFREGSYWDFLDEDTKLTETSLSDIAAAANSEFGTSWDDDYLLDMAGVDDDFRSIDSFGDTLPKTRKSRELSPEKIAEREAKAAEHERQKNMRFAQRYVAKYGAERYNTQYPVGRQNWRQEWPYYDEATGEFVEGERRDELVKKFEDEQHAKRMAEYEERQNQPRWYIKTRYNGKWHNLMNTTATTKEDAESWALDYMKNLEAERRAAGGHFDWKETDVRVVAGKGPGSGVLQRFEEDFDLEELHDLGNEYDGGYPDETPEVSDSHLKLCPECGKENFDIETGICVDCGFN